MPNPENQGKNLLDKLIDFVNKVTTPTPSPKTSPFKASPSSDETPTGEPEIIEHQESWQTVTIDFAKIRDQVEVGTATPSFYHDLNYLNTNVLMPPFKEVRDLLEKGATIEELRKYKERLFKILVDFAYRAQKKDEYLASKFYQEMLNAGSTEEAKIVFVKKCAEIKSTKEGQSHNQPESVVGKLLLNIMEEKKSPTDIKKQLNKDLEEYLKINSNQANKDRNRCNAIFDNNGNVIAIEIDIEIFFLKLSQALIPKSTFTYIINQSKI